MSGPVSGAVEISNVLSGWTIDSDYNEIYKKIDSTPFAQRTMLSPTTPYSSCYQAIPVTCKGVLTITPITKNVIPSENGNTQSAIYIESGGGIIPEIVIDDLVINKDLFTSMQNRIAALEERILALEYAPGGERYHEAESDFKKLIKE